MKNNYLLLFFCFCIFYSDAQVNPVWVTQPALPPNSEGAKVLTDHANGVYVSGFDSMFKVGMNYYSSLVLVKTDANGNFLWKIPFGSYSSANMVKDDSDNIYLDTDGITKIDSAGNFIWQNNAVIPADTNYGYPVRGKIFTLDKFKNIYTLGITRD